MEIKILDDQFLPTLYISIEAMARVQAIVALSKNEVGWMGLINVEQEEDGRSKLVLDSPYVPSQEVNGVTCDLDPSGKGSFAEWAMSLGVDAARVKWWGHSHVDMGVSPSGTDMETFKEHVENDPDNPFVMTIHNKQGKSFSNVYLGGGLFIKDYPILIDYGYDSVFESVKSELQSNVREKKHVRPNTANGHYPGYQTSIYQSPHTGSGGNRIQPVQPASSAGNAESNAMGLRPSGESQPPKPSVRAKGRGKKQSRGNGSART